MVMLLAASWATGSGPSCERAMDLMGGIGLPVPLFEDYARRVESEDSFCIANYGSPCSRNSQCHS